MRIGKVLVDHCDQEIKKIEKFLKFNFLFGGFFLPTAITVLTFSKELFPPHIVWLFWAIFGSLVAIQLWFVFIIIRDPKIANRILLDSLKSDEELKDLKDTISKAEKFIKLATTSATIVYSAFGILRGALNTRIYSMGDLQKFSEKILTTIVENRSEIFAFDGDEIWTFAIYLYNSSNRKLECICRIKEDRHPNQEQLDRSWDIGRGHIGITFANERSKITTDASQDGITDLLNPAASDKKDYDKRIYKSYASLLIEAGGGGEKPYGVLVATSNKESRFTEENCTVLSHLAYLIAFAIESSEITSCRVATEAAARPAPK